jgi:VanZ family protein
VAIGITLILFESTTYFGSNYTTGPLRRVFQAIFGAVSDADWETLHHIIRKCGHFFGYGFIGLTWLRAWRMTLPRSGFIVDSVLALAGTAAVASYDEWHQTYLPNRTGSPWDVLLDCCGAVGLMTLVYLYARLFRAEQLARAA